MKTRHSAEQIVSKLHQADIELGKGSKVPGVCKQLGIRKCTYYRWRTSHVGGFAGSVILGGLFNHHDRRAG